jgi:hypothetical protein
MNLLELYQTHEGDFLEAMATRFGFTGKNRLIFEKRFLEDNAGITHAKLAEIYKTKLIAGTKNGDAAQILRQQVKAICDKLEAAGCPPSEEIEPWKNAKRWLREDRFPEWAKSQGLIATTSPSSDQLWQELKAKVNTSNELEVVVVEPKVGELGARRKRHQKIVPLDSDIEFHLQLDSAGYLILLEREPSGIIGCLCPSEYAPQLHRPLGKMILPQFPPSPYPYFGADEVGREQLIALITQELPPFDWLSTSHDEDFNLEKEHLNGLLEYLNQTRNWQVMYAEYVVVAR